MDQRIKGQDTSTQFMRNGTLEQSINAIRDLSVTAKFEKLQEGYLGETTDRYDEIFKGVDGKISIHTADQGVLGFIQAIIDRAQRRTPGTQFDVRTTLRFPNGQRPRVILRDIFFGDVPLDFASRQGYGTVTLTFSCSQLQRIN